MTAYPCVALDFDGTLVESLEAAYRAFQRIGPDFGFAPIDREQLERLRRLHAREVLESLGVPWHRLPRLAIVMRRAMRTELMQTPPVPGIAESLQALRAVGHRVGILSSNATRSLHDYLRHHGLPSLDFVIGGAALFGKTRALRALLRAQRLRPTELLYVGDELRDLEAAQAAGVAFAAVAWGFTPVEILMAAGADHRIDHPRDLLDLIERNKM